MLRQRYGLVVRAKHRCVCSRRESLDWLRSSRTCKMFMNYWSRFLVLLLLMDPVYCSQRMLFQCYRTTNSERVVKTCGTNFTDAYNPDRFHLRKSIRCIRAPSNCCVLFLVMLSTMVKVTAQRVYRKLLRELSQSYLQKCQLVLGTNWRKLPFQED